MLILTRRVNESIMIGSDITITVLRAHANRVRIAINVPDSVAVHREEILEQVTREWLRAFEPNSLPRC